MKYGFQEGDITTEPGSNMLPSEQSVNKDELVKFVNDEFKRRQDERKAFEIQWRLNQAFIEGNQYLEINPTTLALQEIPKIRIVTGKHGYVNRILAPSRTHPLMTDAKSPEAPYARPIRNKHILFAKGMAARAPSISPTKYRNFMVL